MNRPDPHQRFDELAVGHALSALEPEDEQAFVAHVAGCARCERALDEHVATLAHLAYAAEPVEPPPALLDGIRAGVLASGRGAVFPGDAVAAEQAAAPSTSAEASAPVDLDAARERRATGARRWRRAGGWVGAAAALALVGSLATWNAALQRDRDQQQQYGRDLAQTVEAITHDGTKTVQLTSPDGEVLAVAVLESDDEMSLVVNGLEVNEADATTYVLWGQSRFGDVRAVGAFDVTKPGLDVLRGMRVPDGVGDVTAFMVTHEPQNEPPAVTTQPVLASGEV